MTDAQTFMFVAIALIGIFLIAVAVFAFDNITLIRSRITKDEEESKRRMFAQMLMQNQQIHEAQSQMAYGEPRVYVSEGDPSQCISRREIILKAIVVKIRTFNEEQLEALANDIGVREL